ncbi:MAG: TonB-dependent receptor, partial [Candidatus Marinimicrobia bacterium]|nr:TonB-dependent receptor [Candidatus Neomarinimicrobiota bacterium]
MSMTWAQTTGKISGTITGDDGTQLVGANIIVLGTGSGASAGPDGEFQILNVPAGSYTVLATYIGYSGKEVSGVRVISGLSTEINFSLTPSAIEGEVVQVTAERALIQKDETSSINVITGEQLDNLPIRSLDGVLATIPGVVVQNNDV